MDFYQGTGLMMRYDLCLSHLSEIVKCVESVIASVEKEIDHRRKEKLCEAVIHLHHLRAHLQTIISEDADFMVHHYASYESMFKIEQIVEMTKEIYDEEIGDDVGNLGLF